MRTPRWPLAPAQAGLVRGQPQRERQRGQPGGKLRAACLLSGGTHGSPAVGRGWGWGREAHSLSR